MSFVRSTTGLWHQRFSDAPGNIVDASGTPKALTKCAFIIKVTAEEDDWRAVNRRISSTTKMCQCMRWP